VSARSPALVLAIAVALWALGLVSAERAAEVCRAGDPGRSSAAALDVVAPDGSVGDRALVATPLALEGIGGTAPAGGGTASDASASEACPASHARTGLPHVCSPASHATADGTAVSLYLKKRSFRC